VAEAGGVGMGGMVAAAVECNGNAGAAGGEGGGGGQRGASLQSDVLKQPAFLCHSSSLVTYIYRIVLELSSPTTTGERERERKCLRHKKTQNEGKTLPHLTLERGNSCPPARIFPAPALQEMTHWPGPTRTRASGTF
jgi:hypothetical protein